MPEYRLHSLTDKWCQWVRCRCSLHTEQQNHAFSCFHFTAQFDCVELKSIYLAPVEEKHNSTIKVFIRGKPKSKKLKSFWHKVCMDDSRLWENQKLSSTQLVKHNSIKQTPKPENTPNWVKHTHLCDWDMKGDRLKLFVWLITSGFMVK